MKTDYKFWYIKRNDNGFIIEVAVRFYEGEIIDGKYQRTKRLETFDDLKHLARNEVIRGLAESNGKKVVIYLSEDFGKIKSDDELRLFLNKELAKDNGREPISEQK